MTSSIMPFIVQKKLLQKAKYYLHSKYAVSGGEEVQV